MEPCWGLEIYEDDTFCSMRATMVLSGRIIECLLKWNAAKGEGVFKWSHCDEEVRSSLILACIGKHTKLALRLIDTIDFDKFAKQNNPFELLEKAIESGSEPHALAIAAHPKIQRELQLQRYECTEAAIRQEMADVLQLMDQLNHHKVCRTV